MIDLNVEIPSLPEGWSGTPDELLQFIAENAVFSLDGETPSGQVGGSRPTSDVGVWYGENSIERFINGAYRTISDVPVGAVLPWAGASAVSPENYLFCTGQSLTRADYPELFAVIGTTYGSESGTTFTVPDYRGRVPVGVGIGDYIKQGVTGRMREVIAGEYSGYEWVRNNHKPATAPKTTKVLKSEAYISTTHISMTECTNPRIGQQFIIRYR